MEKLITYVVGFLFSADHKYVTLIEKKKPEWQRGKLNGVGGKIEIGENPIQAMTREFREETGVDSYCEEIRWRQFATLKAYNPGVSKGALVHFFRAFSEATFKCRTTTVEKVMTLRVAEFDSPSARPMVPNLRWLIPMAITPGTRAMRMFEVDEEPII